MLSLRTSVGSALDGRLKGSGCDILAASHSCTEGVGVSGVTRDAERFKACNASPIDPLLLGGSLPRMCRLCENLVGGRYSVDQGLGRLGSLLRAPRNLSRPCRVRRQQAGGRAEAQRLRIAPAFCGTDRRE